jgi:hypothetical protein
MGWIESKSARVVLPAFADVFVRSKSVESFESSCEIVGGDEVEEMDLKLIVAVIVVPLDGGFLDGVRFIRSTCPLVQG